MTSFFQDAARTIEFFSDSYIATLAIAAVVSYLGVFVVLKRIVFLGITLAQAAASGIALAFFAQGYVGHETALAEAVEHHGPTAGAVSVSTLGVVAFALPGESRKVSREALLGLGYALFGGASILLVWRSAKGIDELKNLLAGDVLFARAALPALLWGLGAVATVHLALRKEFLLASYDPEFARTLRMPVRFYELVLALSLGLAISLALKVAGILLVFALLAVPPIAGLALGRKLDESTWIAVAVAVAGSGAGFIAAERADLPVAPTIACVLVALAGLAAGAARAGRAGRVAFFALVGPLALAALVGLVDAIAAHENIGRAASPRDESVAKVASTDATTLDALLRAFHVAADPEVRRGIAKRIADEADDADLAHFTRDALGDEDEAIRETALVALARIGDRARAVRAVERLLRADDPALRLHAALGLVKLGDARGLAALVATLHDSHAAPGERSEAHDALLALHPDGKGFGYDPFGEDPANHRAVLRWEEWLAGVKNRVPTRTGGDR